METLSLSPSLSRQNERVGEKMDFYLPLAVRVEGKKAIGVDVCGFICSLSRAAGVQTPRGYARISVS